jgi:hypothetical protein
LGAVLEVFAMRVRPVRPVIQLVLAFVFTAAALSGLHAEQAKKVLTLADYGPWKRITATVLSDDGKWVSYTTSPNDGDDTLYVKAFDADTLYTINAGSGGGGRGGRGGGGGGAQFSADSKFAAYFVNPPESTGRGRAGGATSAPRGGNAPAGGGNGAAASAPQRRLEIPTWRPAKSTVCPARAASSSRKTARGSR